MTLEEFNEVITNIPKCDNHGYLTTIDSISINELKETIKRFEKIPTFDEIQRENNKIIREKNELIELLTKKIEMCDKYLTTLISDLKESRSAGRLYGQTYISNQLLKNATIKECCEEILNFIK